MKTILVVDDDTNILNIVKYFLDKAGYAVITCNEPDKVVELVKNNAIDLIILDIMMAGKDGLAICEDLFADDTTYTIPVLFLTARSDPADKMLGYMSGARDYLTKPFEKNELLNRVKKILKS